MADDEENDDRGPKGGAQDSNVNTGPAMGPIYLTWENSLEKLKILGYESGFCVPTSRKCFSRVYFVLPAANNSIQFDDFIELCSWLCSLIARDSNYFKKEKFDDPNTVVNKLMLALRELEFQLSIPSQKLKTPYGEHTLAVIDFLVDLALKAKKFQWGKPEYKENEETETTSPDDDADAGDVEDDADVGEEEENLYDDVARLEVSEISLDGSSHQVRYSQVDPVQWKTELERVGPKLRSQQPLATNDWRAHVDQTIVSKGYIEKVVSETKADLISLSKETADELNKMRTKERYINHQFVSVAADYKEIKQNLEAAESVSAKTNERVVKLTNELSELSEKLEEIKETYDSKDSTNNDASPLVRMKAALQTIKQEILAFELRIGVVSHSLLQARVSSTARRHLGVQQLARRRGPKARKAVMNDDYSAHSDDDYE